MFQELKTIYGPTMPPLEISTFKDITSFRQSKPKWLLDINPNGKVPSMQHGDISMFEGGAISSFLLHMYDHRKILLPPDPATIAMYYLFVSWTASNGVLSTALTELTIRPPAVLGLNSCSISSRVSPLVSGTLANTW